MDINTLPPSPATSVTSLDSTEVIKASKRKREEEDEEESRCKRRSEEPLFKIVHKLVDETQSDESESDKENNGDRGNVEVDDLKTTTTESNLETEAKEGKDDDEEKEEEEPEWEVEDIVDYQYCREQQAGLYLVKWVGWGHESNTWEPEAHLQCTNLLVNFYKTRLKEREDLSPAEKRVLELPPDPRETFQIRQDFLREHCPPVSRKQMEKLFQADKLKHNKQRAKIIPEKILNAAVDSCAKKPNEQKIKWIREQLALKSMVLEREAQLKDLRKYEKEINEIDPHAHVSVINDVDLEGPPRQMEYINAYKASEGISIPDDPFIGCSCDNGCDWKQRNCCSKTSGDFHFAYNKQGKLRDVIVVGSPIYECNKRCMCGPDCINRVIQKGRKHKLAIFRTDNGCGWGVKALERISAGSFVVEYVGEVITNEEAEERGKKYDAEGRTYLFDLDFNSGGEDNMYTVDAAFYGNLSHFVNHSCDPNLNIFNVFINNLDPNMPQLALFAKREIKKGEQITFDYCQNPSAEPISGVMASPSKAVKSLEDESGGRKEREEKTQCRCGAARCRKVLF